MAEFYISFGQSHAHEHNGKKLDKDCIGVIDAVDEEAARDKAFEWFGPKWCFIYTEPPRMDFFPRGFIKL